MLIDCFPFFNERLQLLIRLNELKDVCDFHICVESSKTQSLLDKPYYLDEWIKEEEFKPFVNKIIRVKVEPPNFVDNKADIWQMEHYQRNCISLGLEQIKDKLTIDSLICISDVDEIPRSLTIVKLKKVQENGMWPGPTAIEMEFCAYFVNLIATNRKWIGTVVTTYGDFKNNNSNAQFYRTNKDFFGYACGSWGWHLSWLGGSESIYNKTLSCIEPFDKSKLPTKEEFRAHFEDFLGREDKYFIHLEQLDKKETEFTKAKDLSFLPQYLLDNLEKYDNFTLK